MTSSSQWNTFARTNASLRWRKPSAAIGRDVTEAIVAEAQVQPGNDVLDIASGTGEPAISIATLLAGTGSVTATDISPEPLKVAQQRAAERQLTNIRFQPADVHALPFPDGSFDRATCRLGVMFFSDFEKALSEIHRVLRPDGRFSVLAWGPYEQPYFEIPLGTVLRTVPGAKLPDSGRKMFKFANPATLTSAFRAAGFSDSEARIAEIPWNWPSTPEELWAYFQQVTIPFRPLFESIPPELREQVDREVLAQLQKRYDGNEVKFDARVVLASATK